MRKTCLFLAVLVGLMLGGSALAEGELSLSGTLQPAAYQLLTAPFGGRVVTSDHNVGDTLTAGETLIVLDTTRVYAPCDGTVSAVFVEEGEALADCVYSAPLYVEPAVPYTISATTSGAYNSTETKYVHVGESVYLTATSTDKRTGTGVVTQVDGSAYTVEVRTGNLRLSESCYISRSDDSDDDKLRIGSGKTRRSAPVAVTGEGSVLKLHVRQGDVVHKGDLLLETVPGDLHGSSVRDGALRVERDCVLSNLNAIVGDSVQEGQNVAAVYALGTLEAVVQADESDLPQLAVGDPVTVELDSTSAQYAGVVVSISGMTSDAAKGVAYDVRVSFENDGALRQGMSVTVRK